MLPLSANWNCWKGLTNVILNASAKLPALSLAVTLNEKLPAAGKAPATSQGRLSSNSPVAK